MALFSPIPDHNLGALTTPGASKSSVPPTVTPSTSSTAVSSSIASTPNTSTTPSSLSSTSSSSFASDPTDVGSPFPTGPSSTPDPGQQASPPPLSLGGQDFQPPPTTTPPPDDSAVPSQFLATPPIFHSTDFGLAETPIIDPVSFDMSVLSSVVISTDSTSGVHTTTQVTTIASFRSAPTSRRPGHDMNANSASQSQNIGLIVLCVMGGMVACAIGVLLVWWYRRRRRRKINYEFTGYGTTTPGSPTWGQRFGWAFGQRSRPKTDSLLGITDTRFTIGSFGNSTERLTPTPFTGQRSSEALVEKPYTANRVIHFQEPIVGDSEDEIQAVPRNQGTSTTRRDRPPTYHTTSTGVATIATTLPLYSAYDPSPISECPEPETPTSLPTPLSPAYGRDKFRRTMSRSRSRPLATIGEKF